MTTSGADARADRGAQLVRVLVTEAREELLKADSKAGLMLASVGAALTALLGAIGGGVIAPRQYAVIPQVLVWTGCAACLPSLVLLGLAVVPRVGKPRRSRAHYFGDATVAESRSGLEATVPRTDPVDRDLSQLTWLSRTAWIKYRCIRHAMGWATAFLTFTVLGILTGSST
jgi:ABC-type proline/glycine betaine transport system permease subunit